nr:hypothetical protein [Microbispora catharanthi]
MPFVEAAGAGVLLEHVQVEHTGARLLGLAEQRGADAAPLSGWRDGQVVQPVALEAGEAHDLTV